MSRRSEVLAELLSREPMPCIAAAAEEHDGAVLCVGGAVRDALLGRAAADVDIAVAGDLDAFVDRFAGHCARRPVPIGDPVRDTRRTRLDGVQVDVGRMLGTVDEDLGARDFTINAMAVHLGSGRVDPPALVDPHAGSDDLEEHCIRRVSERAFDDDPLRMLRAVRYLAALDGFRVDPATLRAIEAGVESIDDAAAERVQAEWAELLSAPRWVEAARLAFELGLGERTLGWASSCAHAERWSAAEGGEVVTAQETLVTRLAALIVGPPPLAADAAGAALIARRWPRRLAEAASRVAGWATSVADAEVDTVAWALADATAAARAAALGAVIDPEAAGRAAALTLQAKRAAEQRWVTGADLRSWGLAEGPELGALLARAARGQIERRWPDADDARAWTRRRVADIDAGKSG